MSTNTITLAIDAVVEYSMNEFRMPSAKAATTAPDSRPRPPITTTRNASIRYDWPMVGLVDPISVSATPATPAKPEPMKNVVTSVRRDEIPLVSARSRFCTTARMRRPIEVFASAKDSTATATIASTRMKMRVFGTTAPRISTPPVSHVGATTLTAGAPKMSRASCWSTSPTPKVTSRVSSGRWYIRRIKVASSSTPIRPPTTKPTTREISSDAPALETTCCTTYAVYEPAMMNSPWAMLITPIWPKVSDRPSAANNRIDPMLRPVNSCPITTSIGARPSSSLFVS